MENPLKSLQVTNWYTALAALSGVCLVIGLTTQRDIVALLSLGGFLIGIGEWKNHRKAVQFGMTPAGMAKVTNIEWHATPVGVLLDVLGFAMIAFALFRAYRLGAFAI